MKSFKRTSFFKFIAICAILGTCLSSCRKVSPQDVSQPQENSSSSQSTSESQGVSDTESQSETNTDIRETGAFNPYSGLYDLPEDKINTRPIACMINNHPSAWPQNSISNADIIYELPVEGGLTRLMAIYADYTKAEKFGSIRSARHDFVELARPFNAIFIHWGGSTFGYDSIRQNGIDGIDGMKYGQTYFYTDKNLNRSIEHCRFTNPEEISQAISALSINTQGQATPSYQFHQGEDPISFPSTDATSVKIPFSGDITILYEYNTEQQKYEKSEYGKKTLDGNTNEPVLIENVFILFTSVQVMANGEHKDINLQNGSGYYLTRGTRTSIQWTKGNPSDPIKYYLDNGEELSVNPGNSWVLFAPNSLNDKVQFS